MPAIHKQQCVSIGISRRDGLGADRQATTWPIFNDDTLAQMDLHVLG
jgi:hypothetical protein